MTIQELSSILNKLVSTDKSEQALGKKLFKKTNIYKTYMYKHVFFGTDDISIYYFVNKKIELCPPSKYHKKEYQYVVDTIIKAAVRDHLVEE